MQVDYERLKQAVETTVRELAAGSKDPVRRPVVEIRVLRDLQGEVTAGTHRFRTDAARDAGGFGEHPRPMDYLLGALASCQQMWCLRWAALHEIHFTDLVIEAEAMFSWRGEYLQETDSGIAEIRVTYRVDGDRIVAAVICEMADMVAARCPVLATLRRSVPIREQLVVAGRIVAVREWKPGYEQALRASRI